MSLYKTFQTDEAIEQEGILVQYDDVRFRISRAGGSNANYRRILGAKTKKYRRQIENQQLSETVARRLMAETYAESVVLGWDTNVGSEADPVWQPWILDSAGQKLPFSVDNCVRVLLELPELFADIQVMAGQVSNFRKQEMEEDSKN